MMVDLQVAEIPWTTSVGGLGISGYHRRSNVSNMIRSSFNAVRRSSSRGGYSHGGDWRVAAPEPPGMAIVRSRSAQRLLAAWVNGFPLALT